MIDISTLNDAQRDAVTSMERSLLIIAGAGSGKTRTLVYRLAWLMEQGLPLSHMLLLTFTKKAASQMLERASLLCEQNMHTMRSGTFHAFAFSVLRNYPQFCLRYVPGTDKKGSISVMDSADQNASIALCKDELKLAKGDRSFPKSATVISLISKARNKEISIEEVLKKEAQHFLPYIDELQSLSLAYGNYKKKHGLYDYDDLLFEVETLFVEQPHVLEYYQNFCKHIMVDEYQDTNKIQARIIRHLAGNEGHIMTVGDDAQSIYAFRGATIRNILDYPKLFPNTKIIYLEENYRSYQPILNVANTILSQASEGYAKHLYSNKQESPNQPFPVRIYKTLSDFSQAKLAARRIQDLLINTEPHEIAVLFRSGYQSYNLELELNKIGIKYKKYGGIKFTEASHIKDLLAYARLIANPQDLQAFQRIASFAKGVGPKTAQKLYELTQKGEHEKFEKTLQKYQEFQKDLNLINHLRLKYYSTDLEEKIQLTQMLNTIFERYKEHIAIIYPDDYPKRTVAVEEVINLSLEYAELDLFISDLILDKSDDNDMDTEKVIISTVHSSKGLEWKRVLVLDLVEKRFPSDKSMVRQEEFEEERRLLYVACTRAKNSLDLFIPQALSQRGTGGFEPAIASPFIRELDRSLFEEFNEAIGGSVYKKFKDSTDFESHNLYNENKSFPPTYSPIVHSSETNRYENLGANSSGNFKQYGYCYHKIFGRGKIISESDTDKYKINFPNIGIKTILKSFVTLEEK